MSINLLSDPDPVHVIPVEGRACGDCAMCCKLFPIAALDKKEGEWCKFCSTRKGCDAYDTRPTACRTYMCYYMLSTLGEEWRPTTAKFTVSSLENGTLAVISCDPARPDAWRKEPYLSSFKRWAEHLNVYVQINRQMYAIFPDHIDDLGHVSTEEVIATVTEQTADGRTIKRAVKMPRNQAGVQ